MRHLKVDVLVLKELFFLQSSENSSGVDLRMDLSFFEILCEGSTLRLGISYKATYCTCIMPLLLHAGMWVFHR